MRNARRPLAALVAALLGAGAALVCAAPAHAREQKPPAASWSVQPAGENGGAARSSFTYTIKPGTTLRDSVLVANTGPRPVSLDLYAADAFLTDGDGAFALREPRERRTGVGRWTRLGGRSRVTIAPGKGLRIPFEVRVPRNAEPGDHAGAVLAAAVRAEDGGGNGPLGFDVRRRVGTRIYLRVEGPLKPGLKVSELGASGKPALLPYLSGKGKASVDYRISNSGNTRLTPTAELELVGPFGMVVDRVPLELPELLPGSSVSQEVSFDELPPLGLLSTRLVVTSADASTSASVSLWSVPWVPLGLLALLGVGLVVRRRQRVRRDAAEQAVESSALEALDRVMDRQGAGR